MTGSYDSLQVGLSVLIAISASYAALDLAGRVTATHGWARLVWLIGGAISMGVGMRAMHFVGMLAFGRIVPVSYHWPTVLLSLLLPILASALALAVVSQERMSLLCALLSSIVMGGGIVSMHYVGMIASVQFNPFRVFLSVLLAIVFSLWLHYGWDFVFVTSRPGSLGKAWNCCDHGVCGFRYALYRDVGRNVYSRPSPA
jgi:NO-binding membrane sensor protein with MHYT domain